MIHEVKDARNLLSVTSYCKTGLKSNKKFSYNDFLARLEKLHAKKIEIISYTGLSNPLKYKCPECGKEISDKAKSCPKCGYPINYDDQLYDDESEDDYEDDEDNRPTISSVIAVVLGLLAIILKSDFVFSVFGLVFIYDAFVNREFKRKLFIANAILLIIAYSVKCFRCHNSNCKILCIKH